MIIKPLKNKIVKELKNELLNTYGFKTPNDWLFYYLNENRIWLLSPELAEFDTGYLNVELKGLYFCYFDYERLRLSPEGAQLIGMKASKNVLLITDKQAEEIIRGFDIDIETNLEADYLILKTRKGILGVGKNHKNKVLCQFRKNSRIRKL